MEYDYENDKSLIKILNTNTIRFDYYFYINKYEDLKKLNYEDALKHWLEYGLKEGRKCNKINYFKYYFNYELYTHLYKDLNSFSYNDSLDHFTSNGIHENRICFNKFYNTNTYVTICIQLKDENYIEYFLTCIKNIKYIFKNVNVIISLPINNVHTIKNIFLSSNKYDKCFKFLKIVSHKNTNDVYPFLRTLDYIYKCKIKTDVILKLHNFIDDYYLLKKHFVNITTSLTDYMNVLVIQNYLKNLQDFGYISNNVCLKNKTTFLSIKSNKNINEKLSFIKKKFKIPDISCNTFLTNNIYWINNKDLENFLNNNLINYLIDSFHDNYITIFKILTTCIFVNNRKNIFINNNELDVTGIKVGIPTNDFFNQPQTFIYM